MFSLVNQMIPEQVKDLVRSITENQGGQWVEKKELRKAEASRKSKLKFNPKTSRTKSY